jgi:hypothetical protein
MDEANLHEKAEKYSLCKWQNKNALAPSAIGSSTAIMSVPLTGTE